ncbi:MAG: TetR family transcriptional regulator [Candidatus Cloacimonetes bacterium]|nr:TetR family transcriptional regulator [Candidatus Cloacimonadota bacterium]
MDAFSSSEEKIFKAAIDLFCENGFDGTKMQAIADKAGISKASLHYYFRSKDRLFKKVVQNLLSMLITNVTGEIKEDTCIEELLQKLISGYFDMFRKFRKQTFFVFAELVKHQKLLADIIQGIDKIAVIQEILLRLQKEREKGTIIAIAPEDLIINIIAMCIYPLMAEPMIKLIMSMSDNEFEQLLNRRKQVVTDFTLRAILVRS